MLIRMHLEVSLNWLVIAGIWSEAKEFPQLPVVIGTNSHGNISHARGSHAESSRTGAVARVRNAAFSGSSVKRLTGELASHSRC